MKSGAEDDRHNDRRHLQVTASVETLLGTLGSAAAESEFSLPTSSRMVERISRDATITRVLVGADSAVIDVGRARRVVPTTSALEPGGQTNLNNLILLCHRHHWMVHEGGWQIARDNSGRILTIPPIDYLNRHLFPRGPDQRVAP